MVRNIWRALGRGGVQQPQRVHGWAVQVDPIRPTLKAPGTKRLKLKYDGPLSNFAFKFKLRRYIMAESTLEWLCDCSRTVVRGRGRQSFTMGKQSEESDEGCVPSLLELFCGNGRGLPSFTFQLNLSRFGHTSPCPPV